MIFSNKRKADLEQRWSYEGTKMEVVKHFSYLGVCLTHNLKSSTYFQVNESKARSAISRLVRFTSSRKKFPMKLSVNLSQALVKSVFSYGTEIFAWENQESGNKLMRMCFKKCLGIPSCAPSTATELILGRRSYEVSASLRGFRFWRRLKGAKPGSLIT